MTQRGRERKQQLMAYAAARFADQGFDQTSVADIVDGVGVGKGVFYWYFDSKDALLAELLRSDALDLRDQHHRIDADQLDPVGRIEETIRATIHWQATHPDMVEIIRFAHGDERFAPLYRRNQDLKVADLVRHVKDGMVAGQIREGDPVLLAHAILGVTTHLGGTFVHERAACPEEIADAAVAFCRQALLAGSPAADPA